LFTGTFAGAWDGPSYNGDQYGRRSSMTPK